MSDSDIYSFIAYVKVEKKYSVHTIISYENDLRQFFDFVVTTFELNSLLNCNHQVVRSWVVSLMSAQNMATSVNRKISTLRSFYGWAIKKDKISINPMLKVTAPKKPKKLPVVVPGHNLQRLFDQDLKTLAEGENFNSIRDHFIIELLYSTGMRRAELKNLQIHDVDASRKEIRVLGKGNKVRSIPVTDDLLLAFKKYLHIRATVENVTGSALFVSENGKPIYDKMIYNIVRRKLSGFTTLSKKSPHVLRHTFATHMLDEGADLNAIKELLGHASLAATQVYTHNSISKLKDVYKKAHPDG
ncbi:MAG: tyrosine-type recombinase/integrase [Saprospiraceae bacterium]|nr:tyrosine-type recombinase/integrase [Saprospiraceae bacterium]